MLNEKQKRFCEEYNKDSNSTQAAIRAGYAPKAAHAVGSRLLRNAKVQDYVIKLRKETAKENKLTVNYVLDGLRELSERCMQRAPVMVRHGKQLVQKIDEEGRHVWKFDSNGAAKAFELLGKHLQLFTDKIDHSSKDGTMTSKIQIEIIKPSEN